MIFEHRMVSQDEFVDITDVVQEDINLACGQMQVFDGLCLVYSPHTTTCIRLIEPETLLKQDMHDFFERLAPSSCYYRHDNIEDRDVPPDERRNGFSHLRAMLLNHQEMVPIVNGKLDLGKWQRLFYIECDFHPPYRTDRIFKVKTIIGV